MHEMMSNNEVDVVVILSGKWFAQQTHNRACEIRSSYYGRKPMALTLKDADEMINACRSNNIKLFIIKQNRFNTPVVALRKALEKGDLGEVIYGDSSCKVV